MAKKRKKKPLLKPIHRLNRLRWAREHREWTVDDWSRVIWSDETRVNRLCSDGLNYAWVERGSGITDRTVKSTLKFGGGCIMVWGCMTWAGVGVLKRVVGSMDAHQYVDILEDGLLPTISALAVDPEMPPPSQLIFQQDNDPKHKSRLAMSWLEEEQGIRVMRWPAQSPDLNPIEHLWAHLKRQLGSYPEAPGGVEGIMPRIRAEWTKITAETCRNLIQSMPRRVSAVIRAKGGHTRY